MTATNGTSPLSAFDEANVTGKPGEIHIVKAINAFDPTHPSSFEDANAAPAST